MRYLTFPLLAFFVSLAISPSTWGQDFQAPRRTFDAPTRSTLDRDNRSSDIQDLDSKSGVMGKSTAEYQDINRCFAQLIEDVEVPAEETGKLVKIDVQRGATVTRDQQVALIDTQRTQRMLEEAQLKFDQANQRATDEISINAAFAKLQLASEEFTDTQQLYRKGAKSKTEYKRAAYSMEIAQLELDAARKEKILAAVESDTQQVAVNAAKDSLQRHKLKSSLDGEVFEVLKDAGEWVQAGETVMRIVRMDKLRIQGFVDSNKYNPPDIEGRRVTAYVNLAGGEQVAFDGEVTHVSLENYSDKFQIDVDIVNRKYPNSPDHWILREGTEMNIRIHFK